MTDRRRVSEKVRFKGHTYINIEISKRNENDKFCNESHIYIFKIYI